jgi:hypothetical protein
MEEVKHEICKKCKCGRLPSEFLSDKGRKLKTCEKCRAFGRMNVKKCPHDKRKSRCRECKGSSFCIHDKIKSRCRECKGSSFCVHDKIKSRCRECKGSSFCIHDKIKSRCRECKGSSFCIHDKQKKHCRECGGSQICIHDKQKSQCRECGGSQICIHDKHKSTCRECGGSKICIHDKRKSACRECDFPKNPQNWCPSCTFIKPNKRSFTHPYCFQCFCVKFPDADIPRKFKLKENHMVEELKLHFADVKMVFDKRVDGGCSARRPDVRIECLTHTIVVECDENAHKGYSCENKRTMQIFQDLGSRPIVFIRFNPDKYKGKVCFTKTKTGACSINKKEWNIRIKLLIETIKTYTSVQEKNVHTVHLFYS